VFIEPITSVCISHDSNCVLVSCLDGKLRLMERATGEMLNEYVSKLDENCTYEAAIAVM